MCSVCREHVLGTNGTQPYRGVPVVPRSGVPVLGIGLLVFYPRLVLAVPGSSAASAQVGTPGGLETEASRIASTRLGGAAPPPGTEALRVALWRGGRAVAILFHTQSDRAIRHTAMARIEKTVFISYRRTDESWALAVFENLTQHGYDVFIDYDGIASGSFETAILENIRARAHFLVLLTPAALARCGDPKDWMRREIEAALDSQRNIVPLMLAGFDFGKPAIARQLTGKLAALKEYNGLEIPKGYFSPAMERLRNKFLSVSLDTVLHPASFSAQQAATEQKDKATMALGDAVHQPWLSPEERRKQEEAAAQHRAEEERRRQEELQQAEARRIAEEERRRQEAENKRRLDEAEKRRRAEEEARRQEKLQVEARQRAEEEEARRWFEERRRQEAETEAPWVAKKERLHQWRGAPAAGAAAVALLMVGGIWLYRTTIPAAVQPDAQQRLSDVTPSAAPATPLSPARFSIKSNTGVAGVPIGSSPVDSISECEQKCAKSTICKIFTYNKTSRWCDVYSDATFAPNQKYDSGIRN
jgi:hypothetical protein